MNTSPHKLSGTCKTRTPLVAASGQTHNAASEHVCGVNEAGLATQRGLPKGVAQLLANTICIRDMYVMYGERATGAHARLFELVCQRHSSEHNRLIDLLRGLLCMLGKDPLITFDIFDITSNVPHLPRRIHSLEMQVQQLVNVHEVIGAQAIDLLMAPRNTLLSNCVRHEVTLVMSELILTSKLHVRLLNSHLHNVSIASQSMPHAAREWGDRSLPIR